MGRNVTIKNMAEVAAARAARPDYMKPQKVNGVWHHPKMNARRIANYRKHVLRTGGVWQWDIPHKEVQKKIEFKGHRRDLEAKLKRERIARAMKKMPQLVADYRERERKRRREKRFAKIGTPGLIELMQTPREYGYDNPHPGVRRRE